MDGILSPSPTSYWFLSKALSYTASVDGTVGRDTGSISINGGSVTPANGTGTNISITGYVPFPNRNELDLLFVQINTARTWTYLAQFNPDYIDRASKIDIAEIILLSSPPSVSDRQKIEGYLAHKWGFTAKLPAEHPYKEVSP